MNPNGPPGNYTGGMKITNPLLSDSLSSLNGEGFLAKFLPSVVGLLLVFGSVAFFFMFLWGAVSWILSGGDKAHVEAAKNRITNALIGFVLMIGVFAVAKLIKTFFDIDILSIDIGPLVIQ
jgi:hypothetical protein